MRTSQGYTLMEMMVVVVIMTVVLAIAVPRFQNMQADNKIASAANALAADLKRIRSEALMQRRNLDLIALGTDSTDPWGSGGWKIENKARSETIMRNQAIPPSLTIVSNPVVTDIVFVAASGMVTKTDGTAASIEFKVCDGKVSGEIGRSVLISQFGRVVVKKHSSSSDCT